MLADGVGQTRAGVLRGNACPRHQLFDEFFTVGARQLVRTLGHDKLRGKVGAHAGGVDHTAARCHDLIKGIVDIHRAQRIAAKNFLCIAHVRAETRNVQYRFYFAAFGGVFGQRKAAFTVGNITAERLSLAACTAQIVDCLFQLGRRAPHQNRVISFFTDELRRGKPHAAAAACDNAYLFHNRHPLFFVSVQGIQCVEIALPLLVIHLHKLADRFIQLLHAIFPSCLSHTARSCSVSL